jgi:hypothetical protein
LYAKVLGEFKLESNNTVEWNLYLDRAKSNHLPISDMIHVKEVISHGDMIYLLPTSLSGDKPSSYAGTEMGEEDEVDSYLLKQDGLITRQRDEQL